MTKEEILENIETILPVLQQYIEYKSVQPTGTEFATIKTLAKILTPERTWCWTCSSSSGELLTVIYSYYHRESQKPAEGDKTDE